MCVPIDYAEKDHVVMFCIGYGDILRKPFSVKNTLEGVKFLIGQGMRSCRQRHIKKEYVFFGGEDANSYAETLLTHYVLKDSWWPTSMPMMLKNSGKIYRPVPIEST